MLIRKNLKVGNLCKVKNLKLKKQKINLFCLKNFNLVTKFDKLKSKKKLLINFCFCIC